jgi:hypothetical protein
MVEILKSEKRTDEARNKKPRALEGAGLLILRSVGVV